jgi:hypothetical protein
MKLPAKSHGMTKTKIYNSWRGMKERCDNPNNNRYSYYGARGIMYNKKWVTFEGFYSDMGESYLEGFELDRIDVNGNYCKENCRWTTQSEQCYNQRKRTDNKSGKTGVGYHKRNKKWTAFIRVNDKQIYLGSFEIFEDAVKAREEAELKYYGYLRG